MTDDRTGKFVLLFHGTAEEVAKTRQVLDQAEAAETALHVEEAVDA